MRFGKKIGDTIVLEFLLDILISFMVLGISLVSAHIVKFKSSTVENIIGITGLY